MNAQEFEANLDYVLNVFFCNVIIVCHFLWCFIVLIHLFLFLCISSLFFLYAHVSIESIDCIVLSLLVLNAILITL